MKTEMSLLTICQNMNGNNKIPLNVAKKESLFF